MKIKMIFAVALSLLFMFSKSSVAETRSPATIEKELKLTTKVAVQAYRKGGMAELFQMVEDCYQKVEGKQFVCLYLDLASLHIDQTISAAMNYPPNDNFSNTQVISRINPVLKSARMDRETASRYLVMTISTINKLVDQELAAAAHPR